VSFELLASNFGIGAGVKDRLRRLEAMLDIPNHVLSPLSYLILFDLMSAAKLQM
jgi:hypothetical protein